MSLTPDADIITEINCIKIKEDRTVYSIDSSIPVTPEELLEIEPIQRIIGGNSFYFTQLSEDDKMHSLNVYHAGMNIIE